jgi:putative ABC transport system permease protein
LGTAIAIFTLDYNTILSQRFRLKRQYGKPDLELQPKNRYQADIKGLEKEILGVQGIEAVTPIFFYSTNLYINQDKPINIFLCGLTPKANKRFNAYRLVNGVDLSAADDRTILLTSTIAKDYRIKLGEYVFLKKTVNKPVSSKCFSSERTNLEPWQNQGEQWGKFKVVGFIAPVHLGARNNAQVGILPFYAGEGFFSGSSIFPFFWAQKANGRSLEELKAELSGLVNVSRPSFAVIGESSMERAFRNGVHICGLFALGLGLFVVFNSFSMSLMERVKQIGLLRLTGATSIQICLIFLAEAAMIAVVASSLGLMMGLGLTRILMFFRITTLGLGKTFYFFYIPWCQVLSIIGLGIIMDFGGALYPILRARKISPVRAIFPRESETEYLERRRFKSVVFAIFAVFLLALYFLISPYLTSGKQSPIFILSGLASLAIFFIFLILIPLFSKYSNRLAYLCLSPFYKLESRMAQKNIENSPSRIGFSVCALMLMVAGALSLKTMIKSMNQEIDHWADVALQDKVFFYSSRKISLTELHPLRELAMVEAFVPMSATVTTPYFIKGVDAGELAKFGPFAENLDNAIYKDFRQSDSLIISTQFARNYNLTAGDRLTLFTSEGEKKFRILTVMDNYGFFPFQRAYALMEESRLARYFCVGSDEIDQFTIKLKKGYSFLDLRREIWHRLKWPANFYTSWGRFILSMTPAIQTKKIFHKNIRPNFIIFDVILYMVVVLIGVGTLNSLLISALERKKEIGLMRVVGMSADQIFRILLIEGGMIGLVSGILGTLMGVFLSVIAIQGLEVVSGLQLGYPVSPWLIVISFVGAIALATIAGIYPAKKTRQFSVIEAIQYE